MSEQQLAELAQRVQRALQGVEGDACLRVRLEAGEVRVSAWTGSTGPVRA